METIVKVDELFIIKFIEEAKYRVAYVAPGISQDIAQKLSEKWASFDPAEVKIVLDVDPEICRLGYGSAEALKYLNNKAVELGSGRLVCNEKGIRIGIIISDSKVCFFAPIALLIESGIEEKRPNGIILDPVPKDVLKELGFGETGEVEQKIGLDKVNSARIEAVVEDIKKNPPQKFDVARQVHVFNARFEFVELKVEGCFLSKHKVAIPPELMGIVDDENLQERLRGTFQLITGNEISGKKGDVSEDTIKELRKKIEDNSLENIDGYGKAVLRENKESLIKEIENLKIQVKLYRNGIKDKLEKSIKSNTEALVEQLFPALKSKVPSKWKKDMGGNPPDSMIKKRLRYEIAEAFGNADKYLKEMKVEVIFKNVSYESLQEKKFQTAVAKAFKYLDSTHEEYDALKGIAVKKEKPFSDSEQPNLFGD